MRQIAGTWAKRHGDISPQGLFAFTDLLWKGRTLEELVFATLLLWRFRKFIPSLTQKHFDSWRRKLDNWGSTDGLGVTVLGPWVLADTQRRIPYLKRLIGNRNLWSRRLALNGAIALIRSQRDGKATKVAFEFIDRVKHERDPMITKAVSWLLREVAKVKPGETAAYLARNRATLPALALRETENKLRTGLKSGKRKHSRHPY